MTNAQPQQSYGLSPRWSEITQELLFDEIWERPILTPRERSIVVVSALIAQYRGDQLKRHIIRALGNGVTKEELGEIFLQLAFYSGWPAVANATTMAEEAIEEWEQT
jgi:4-carboxymuconolactone decarboxylase